MDRTRCPVSASVPPPAASTSRWCREANGHATPSRPYANSRLLAIRRERLPLADAYTPQTKAMINGSYSVPIAIQSGLVETPHTDSSLTVWEMAMYPSYRTAQIAAPY